MAEDGQRLMPTRELKTVPYSLDRDKNIYETLCYQEISDWLENNGKDADVGFFGNNFFCEKGDELFSGGIGRICEKLD